MAAKIVYEGVSGGGELFKGLKFHLLQRIPTRNYFRDLVTANGGELVKVDKQADIIIADHARKDAPAGSISWKFIEQSVRNGVLEDVDDLRWRAGPTVHKPRESGSSAPTRKGRTPFTNEDDRELIAWCQKAERKGISTKGNELYKQLEERNPRHTFQSWRDRWLKQLAHLHYSNDTNENEDDLDVVDGTRSASPQVRLLANRRDVIQAVVRPAPTQSSQSPRRITNVANDTASREARTPKSQPFIATSAGGDVFTEEETAQLFEIYSDIINISDDKNIDAWIAYASLHKNHTAQEWRNYFNEYVVPKKKAEDASLGQKPSGKEERALLFGVSPPGVRGIEKAANEVDRRVKMPQSSNFSNETSSPKLRRHASGQVSKVQGSQNSSHSFDVLGGLENRKNDSSAIKEQEFRRDLLVLAMEVGLERDQVIFNPVICGRKVPLFRLWQVVQSEELGGYDAVEGLRLWPKVASKLNFNPYSHPTAAEDLKTCFGELLADFAAIRAEVDDSVALTNSQEAALIEQQLGLGTTKDSAHLERNSTDRIGADEEDIDEEELDDNDLNSPQFTPKQMASSSSSKRSFKASQAYHSNGYNKRQRIESSKPIKREIPSTPEEIYNEPKAHPVTTEPSPLKTMTMVEEDETSSDSEDLFVKPFKLSRSKSKSQFEPKSRNLEPETQDFHFPQDFKDHSIQHLEQELEVEDVNDSQESSVHVASPDNQLNSKITIRGTESSHIQDNSTQVKRDSSNPTNRGSMPSPYGQDSSTQSQTESERQAALQEYVDHSVSLGYPQDTVIEALETTSMETEHAYEVMESLMNGDGIPDNIKGVWTQSDDEALDFKVDSEEFRSIVKKHGYDRCRTRRKFLKEFRRCRESESEDGARSVLQ